MRVWRDVNSLYRHFGIDVSATGVTFLVGLRSYRVRWWSR